MQPALTNLFWHLEETGLLSLSLAVLLFPNFLSEYVYHLVPALGMRQIRKHSDCSFDSEGGANTVSAETPDGKTVKVLKPKSRELARASGAALVRGENRGCR